jgi:hypothetical protein
MSAQNGNTTPPRTGMRRLILPIEYRHLSIWGRVRIGSGIFLIFCGLATLSVASYGWTAFFLVLAPLEIAAGYWYITIARSASPRT